MLTHENYRSKNLEGNKATFYESGKTAVVNFRAALDRAGLGLAPFSSCVEYGCGLGRLTIWLAYQFASVIGCDISQPHLDAARLALDERGIENVSLRLTDTIKAVRQLPPFDVFFSLIVLQHNPPPVAAFILDEILGKLAPGRDRLLPDPHLPHRLPPSTRRPIWRWTIQPARRWHGDACRAAEGISSPSSSVGVQRAGGSRGYLGRQL